GNGHRTAALGRRWDPVERMAPVARVSGAHPGPATDAHEGSKAERANRAEPTHVPGPACASRRRPEPRLRLRLRPCPGHAPRKQERWGRTHGPVHCDAIPVALHVPRLRPPLPRGPQPHFRATGIAPQRWTVAGGPVERTAPRSPGKRSAPGAGTDTRMKDPGRTGEPGHSRPTYECALRLSSGCGLRPRLRLLLRPCPGHVPKEAGALGADAWPSALRCNTRGFKLCARACKPRLQAGD